MARQQQYIARLAEQLDGLIQADEAFIGSLYDELKPYLITNLSRGALINRAWTSRAYGRTLHEIEGTYQVGTDEFMQFYADETVLQQIVLELFYQKVE